MKKLILSLVLIFFILLSSRRIYAYNQDLSTPYLTNENTHILMTQNMVTEDGKNLVPTGAILGVNDVEEIVFTYNVFVQKNIEIEYFVKKIELNNESASSEISNLFTFEFEERSLKFDGFQASVFEGEEEGRYIEVTLILSMDFPTKEQFSTIAGQQLSFEIAFESGK